MGSGLAGQAPCTAYRFRPRRSASPAAAEICHRWGGPFRPLCRQSVFIHSPDCQIARFCTDAAAAAAAAAGVSAQPSVQLYRSEYSAFWAGITAFFEATPAEPSNKPCGQPDQQLLGAFETGSEASPLFLHVQSSQLRLLHVRCRNRHGVRVRRGAHRVHHPCGSGCAAADPHQGCLPLPHRPQRQATPHPPGARRYPRVGPLAAAGPEVTCQHASCTACAL